MRIKESWMRLAVEEIGSLIPFAEQFLEPSDAKHTLINSLELIKQALREAQG